MDEAVWDSEARAERVLDAYTERRRQRRGEDTWFGDPRGLLEGGATALDPEAASRRRADVVQEALDAGIPPELAELMYDIAWDEGLDPVLAYELVRSGLGVLPPREGLENASGHGTVDKYRPEWLEPPVDPDTLLRERTLRVSFRRLRGFLEQNDDPAAAFQAFAREPDVGHVGY